MTDPITPLREALAHPVADRRPWSTGAVNVYIATFLWVAYFDRLAPTTLAVGGLLPAVLGAVAAGLIVYLLFYQPAALAGTRARQPLAVIATSSFGAAGAPWLPGALLGLVHVAWFAVATHLAAHFTLAGLAAVDMVDPSAFEPADPAALGLRPPLYLVTTLVWALTFAMVGAWFVRLVTAIMLVFPIAPAVGLAALMLWGFPGLGGFATLTIDPTTAEPVAADFGQLRAFLGTIGLISAFAATVGAAATDWGATALDDREARRAGLVGIAGASAAIAAIALLAVAGGIGRSPALPALAAARELPHPPAPPVAPGSAVTPDVHDTIRALDARNWTIEGLIARGIGGRWACLLLFVFALGSMAAAVYAGYGFGGRFATLVPGLPRPAWTFLGAVASWPLMAWGVASRIEQVTLVLGALVAPILGVVAAESARTRRNWPGPRGGVNPAGFLAWTAGAAAGLAVAILPWTGGPRWSQLVPGPIVAFVAAWIAFRLLAALKIEPPALDLAGPTPESPSPAATAG